MRHYPIAPVFIAAANTIYINALQVSAAIDNVVPLVTWFEMQLYFMGKACKKIFQLMKHVFKNRHQPCNRIYCPGAPGFNKNICF